MSITFIGGGNMATALIGGMQARGHAARDFRVVEPIADQRHRLEARFPGVVVSAETTDAAVAGAGVIVLAVKPQQMRAASNALASHLPRTDPPVVLSIAAGIRLADLGRWLGGTSRLVRAMPNTPALIGKGISGAFAAPGVDSAGRALAAEILEAGGELVWVASERMLDAVTGVSGSGPAYVFYFLEALEEAARDQGFGPDGRAAACVRDVRRRDRAGAGQRRAAGDAARASDVEGRHDRACAGGTGNERREGDHHRGRQRRRRARARAGRRVRL